MKERVKGLEITFDRLFWNLFGIRILLKKILLSLHEFLDFLISKPNFFIGLNMS
jgi:hypothetical protein